MNDYGLVEDRNIYPSIKTLIKKQYFSLFLVWLLCSILHFSASNKIDREKTIFLVVYFLFQNIGLKCIYS